ncbi:MAG: hypothetical protein C0613_04595 [Desulfobulbaceae bacterium]|nr:MAG: hypothetical protein C0613_04595 [Desulfobulbaceae bacterium]
MLLNPMQTAPQGYSECRRLPYLLRARIFRLTFPGSLSDLENRSENSKNQGQIYMDLRRIAELFNEKPWEYGPIFRICSRFMSKSDRLLAAATLATFFKGLSREGEIRKAAIGGAGATPLPIPPGGVG